MENKTHLHMEQNKNFSATISHTNVLRQRIKKQKQKK